MSVGQRVQSELSRGPNRRVLAPRITGAARAFLAASLIQDKKLPILVGDDAADAEALFRDLAFLLGTSDDDAPSQGILFLAADEKSPYEETSPDPRTIMERLAALYRLSKERSSVRAVVLSPRTFAKRQVPPSIFEEGSDYLVAKENLDRERLLSRLIASGYNSVSVVEDPGTFSVRGGIIDIFSPYLPKPFRLDLFGDEIESIRLFDPATQRTERELEDAVVLPAREIVFTEGRAVAARAEVERLAEEALIPSKKLSAIADDIDNHIQFFGIETLLPLFHPGGLVPIDSYLPRGEDVVAIFGGSERFEPLWTDLFLEARHGLESAQHSHSPALPIEAHLADGAAVLERALSGAGLGRVESPELVAKLPSDPTPVLELGVESTEGIRAEILKATRAQGAEPDLLHPITHRLKQWRADGLATVIACHSRGQAERLKSLLSPKGVQVRLRTKPIDFGELVGSDPNRIQTGSLRDRAVHAWLALGELSGGFVFPAARVALVSEEEIFGQRLKPRRRRAAMAGAFVSDLADLKPGDYVVHLDYGIGLYHGMTRLAVSGVDSDFLNIEYKGGDKLYLPVHRLRLVQKYASSEDGKKPELSKLGTQTWVNTKKKVKDHLLKIAAELLRLYAMRASIQGFALPAPNETFIEFEAEFPYETTPDQQKAIEDVIRDLQKEQPMDRLISGDVGYGKTEVAIRAAMMAVLGRKQVAVLVPTTVLAAQHYHVFKERFSNFDVKVGIVSRFETPEEIKKNLAALAEGQLDVIIGTHRLLSKDVKFKDLGLLVIDEEHRFGVVHKEKLKKYRAKVHVLTMSATPIPRTLHMGFMGVRDMSVIATPPEDRLAVKTEVHKFSEEVIRDAVLQEIRRGGQCFVVHNRVASIDAFARFLRQLVPEARVTVGHGQMAEDQLEKTMVDFMNKQYNVLLSTTIIESGIDIPNANTILINRADRLGLAQLYQLRGRVGRSKVRGFAHFLIPAGSMSKDAKKRIAVLQRFTELGAGFKVASHDLEIRGAGNLLGKEQSGSISAVGFEMYQALLGEAIEELKGAGERGRSVREAEIQVPVPALIPDTYVPPPGERLAYYQRFNRADTDEATYDLLQEIADLHGTPPAELENLGSLMLVKQRLSRLGGLALDYGAATKQMPARIVIRFDPEQNAITADQLVAYVQRNPRARKLTPDGRLMVHLVPFEDPREILTQSRDQLDELLKLRLAKAS
jgi:transcription-repair coupling factor (superfamily II helicase)